MQGGREGQGEGGEEGKGRDRGRERGYLTANILSRLQHRKNICDTSRNVHALKWVFHWMPGQPLLRASQRIA